MNSSKERYRLEATIGFNLALDSYGTFVVTQCGGHVVTARRDGCSQVPQRRCRWDSMSPAALALMLETVERAEPISPELVLVDPEIALLLRKEDRRREAEAGRSTARLRIVGPGIPEVAVETRSTERERQVPSPPRRR